MLHIRAGSQVQIWRRRFDVLPPPMDTDHKHYNEIVGNPKFRAIKDKIPQTESLETTMLRVVPFWNSTIVPDIKSGKRVLVVCHGTSLRGIVKHVDRELTSSSFSSIGTTAHRGLWPVEQYPSIFPYLSPTLSIFSLPALEEPCCYRHVQCWVWTGALRHDTVCTARKVPAFSEACCLQQASENVGMCN